MCLPTGWVIFNNNKKKSPDGTIYQMQQLVKGTTFGCPTFFFFFKPTLLTKKSNLSGVPPLKMCDVLSEAVRQRIQS